ncbi:MAG: hypothetical protein AB7P04_02310 [Bacteriovoracia bacterium]
MVLHVNQARFDKSKIVAKIVSQLEEEARALEASALAAHAAATHEESKSEDKHDTRGLEASYLAGAQGNRVLELRRLIAAYRTFSPAPFDVHAPLAPGALVELDGQGRKTYVLLVEHGGGIRIEYDAEGRPILVQTLSIQSPLGEAVFSSRLGEDISLEGDGKSPTREYSITGVW